ncbi:hypothetical protein NDU88_003613 [Pleurodeles waltl]|uniref:Myb/SANT-like DNA-binding domain-containing protein n=1 Tax=Pleurodeles waltl TaxID=8319 RepID=A0AAV7NJS3_PLEWA|nr:hypothetical protein NDU88_003613 [Pleurodeles waltl]
MAAASGERAPAFTAQELEKLVDGVLPQYTLLYDPPDQQVSAHQKRDIWHGIAKEVRTLGAHQRRGTHCRKRWEDIRRCSKKTAEAQLGMASQRGRGACRTMTPMMFRILVVAYPELDGRLRTSQQTQGVSSGGGTVAPEHEGAASHMAMEGHTTDSDFTSGTEGEGSFTSATGSPTSDTDSSADGSSPVVAAPSVRPTSTGGEGPEEVSPTCCVTAEKCAIISGGPDTTASTLVTGQETTARDIAQEGSSIVTDQETTARVIAQEGSSIVTGPETTTRVIAQEGSSIVTGQETTATARDIAQEGSSIITGQETTARVIAQEGSSIVTGQETTARVIAQEGSSIVTGPETTARVIAQEG